MSHIISGEIPPAKLKKAHSPQEKHSDPMGSQKISWRVLRRATISLWGILLLARGNLELANAPTNPWYYRIDAVYDCYVVSIV